MDSEHTKTNDDTTSHEGGSRAGIWTAVGLLLSGATGLGVGYLLAKPKAKDEKPCACKANGNGNGNGGNGNGGNGG